VALAGAKPLGSHSARRAVARSWRHRRLWEDPSMHNGARAPTPLVRSRDAGAAIRRTLTGSVRFDPGQLDQVLETIEVGQIGGVER
jgi:hypothetical protein